MVAGNRRHSAALVLLASTLMMLAATSHCTMSTTSSTSAGNGTAASSAWCDGHIVDGQCILIAQDYGGGNGKQLEYDDSGETSSRRVLDGGPKINIYGAVRNRGEFCYTQKSQRYTCLNKPNNNGRIQQCPKSAIYNRVCVQ